MDNQNSFLVHGEMKEIPLSHAPLNYHHPGPTLACLEACIKECFPGVTKIETADEPARIGKSPTKVAISIEHNYTGQAQAVFAEGVIKEAKRHLPKTHSKVLLVLNFLPHIYLQQAQ